MMEELIIDEQAEQETVVSTYEYLLVTENEVNIMEPAFIGFSICGIMCLISLGISVILSIIRRVN